MPKIDLLALPALEGSDYPSPFDTPCISRVRRRPGKAGGLKDFGVNLLRLPPGGWSSQRHWHSHEDEFVYVVDGEVVLVEDGGETLLRAGDCAAFPKNTGDGHHIINRGTATATLLEIGSRFEADVTTYSDIDVVFDPDVDGYVHRDGSSYPKP